MNTQNTLSSILFSSSSISEFISQLNVALKALIDNDKTFVNENGASPKVWECKWLNSTNSSNGYPKGHAVWLNTNTYEQITSYYYRTLEQYITNNATLNAMYATIDKNDNYATNQFFLSAANGTASPNVSAIYFLGDMSQPVQIRVSKVDNNKELPTTSAWEDFFTYSSWDDNFDLMMNAVASAMTTSMNQHMQQYHINTMSTRDLSNLLQQRGYFKKTPFNVADVQTQWFFDHEYCTEISGFDYIKHWKISPDGNAWCKIWNSGYVEQGGFVENVQGMTFIPVQFMTTYDYPAGAAFYQRDYQTYNKSYSIDNPMQANDRYVMTVTPVLKKYSTTPYPQHPIDVNGELVYSSVDVTNMSNAGFSIVNTDVLAERYSKYSWYVSGYKVITGESQMFNGSIMKTASDMSCFTIVDNVLVGFDNDGYTHVVVPDGVASIGNTVFAGCSIVESFTLPSTLTSVGSSSFAGCSSLKGVVIPDTVTSISSQAFSPCDNLAYVSMGPNVNFIGTSAFCNDTKLREVTRFDDEDPSHRFNMVGDYAFYNTSMKKLNLTLRSAAINSFWGDYCFAENKNLEEVNILSSSYMSNHMFSGCTKLSSVNFKNNYVSYVYPNVFDGCISLTSMTLPSKIWYISEEMFKDCSALETIEFNDYETSMINLVQRNAFNGCSSLKSIELPATVDTISCLDDACLSNCALTSITFHGISKSQLLKNSGAFIDEIASTGMLRLYHDCTIVCKDGEALQFNYDSRVVLPYVEPLDYMASVDVQTTSGFNVASAAADDGHFWWYYNAEQLCAQAYKTETPCLFIYSLLGCKPCQIYAKDIFNNKDFQNWAKKQNFYLCSIEGDKQPYYDTALAFCSDRLRPTALNVAKEYEGQTPSDVVPNALDQTFSIYADMNSNLMTPVLLFCNNSGGKTTTYAYTYHEIDNQISEFGISGVIQCLKSLCLYHFDNNDLDNAKYVVDAGKAFDINDYVIKRDESSKNDVVVPIGINGSQLMTIDDVNADIVQRLEQNGSLADNQVNENGYPYMGGCDLEYIDYISSTFAGIAAYEGNIQRINEFIAATYPNKKFKIGDGYYTFSLSETDVRLVHSPCFTDEITMGLVQWTKLDA